MLVHLNGQLVPAEQARVSVFDRGFIFGDGIYEGLRSVKVDGRRRVIGVRRHQRRLSEGLKAVGIEWDASQLGRLVDELLAANGLDDAFIYWQVTRGTPPIGAPVRSRVPAAGTRATVMGYCTPFPGLESNREPACKPASVQEDIRWRRGEVKSTSLLGNIIVSMAAGSRGGDEAILVRDGLLTEGGYTNVVLATADGEVVTPSLASAPMLSGVTRQILLELDRSIVERAVRAEEIDGAREVMLVGTTTMVTSVTSLDGRIIGDGRAGPHARRLLGLLVSAIREGREDLPALGS